MLEQQDRMAYLVQKPVMILGGGLIGLTIAHELARQGLSIEVLSRNSSESAGLVAAGMLAPHAEGLNGHLLQLGQASLSTISHWVKAIELDSGIQCGLRECGIVVPFQKIEDRNICIASRYCDGGSTRDKVTSIFLSKLLIFFKH